MSIDVESEFRKWSEELSKAVRVAVEQLGLRGGRSLCVDHVLYGAMFYSPIQEILRQHGAHLDLLRSKVSAAFPRVNFPSNTEPSIDDDLKSMLVQLRALSSVNIFDAVIAALELNPPNSIFLRGLHEQRISVPSLIKALIEARNTIAHQEETYQGIPPDLETFVVDMVQRARSGAYLPISGREEELNLLMTALLKRHAPNAVLVGPSGVGKTALAEELARRVAEDKVPQALRGRPVWFVDIGGSIAGTVFRGSFEQRIRDLIEAARRFRAILVMDEIHMIVGAGNEKGGADAANMLKTALARGDITVIGTTTSGEFRRSIGADPALSRRFSQIYVKEPTGEQLVRMLEQQVRDLEAHHGVRYDETAIAEAIRLASFTGERNPAGAIKLLDMAGARCARLRMDADEPAETDIESLISKALESGDFEEMLRLQSMHDGQQAGGADTHLHIVTRETIQQELARQTGVALELIAGDHSGFVSRVTQAMEQRIIGQPQAIRAIETALRLRSYGIGGEESPIGTFLFVGPTGVGKTEAARVLAEALFGSPDHCVIINMAQFKSAHDISSIFGAPPGYVGYGDAGLLEPVVNQPYKVIVLDEIEKAHPDALTPWLEAIETGQITTMSGKSLDIRNCVVIMTSNAGMTHTRPQALGLQRGSDGDQRIRQSEEALKNFLPPEFLGRINAIVHFNPLQAHHLAEIARQTIADINEKMRRQHPNNPQIEMSERALQWIGQAVASLPYGARGLRHRIENYIIYPMLRENPKGKVWVDLVDDLTAREALQSLRSQDFADVALQCLQRKEGRSAGRRI